MSALGGLVAVGALEEGRIRMEEVLLLVHRAVGHSSASLCRYVAEDGCCMG
jgi:hypothetical protein